ncbi:translation elongation factor Ts [Puniceicoccus vermicola]|uniref:Elongation factor Ts n=1 Tax=Puniceicoccus vermicola TaxID=388746 RepID=A0A7X1AXP7_9BACT|nr:translation elongation factor Ts [Puniceicoccus vermicola]MBC2601928.1 translation elongation factor Ts [Puniceicoccus vermicola]
MSQISAKLVADLRAQTGAGLMDCKKALLEAAGDAEQAIAILRKKGVATAAKKAGRDASEGIVESYIHLGGKVGVLVELKCETDFVAKNDDFKAIAKDLAMHVAAASPLYVNREDVPEEVVEKEREIAVSQAEGKPPQAIQKIVEGKLDKYFSTICLMEQPFVKNPDQSIRDLLTENVSKMGENLVIGRFARFQLGE